jgi:putative hemolysin
MVTTASVSTAKRGERLFVEIASTQREVREAQALRYRVIGGVEARLRDIVRRRSEAASGPAMLPAGHRTGKDGETPSCR